MKTKRYAVVGEVEVDDKQWEDVKKLIESSLPDGRDEEEKVWDEEWKKKTGEEFPFIMMEGEYGRIYYKGDYVKFIVGKYKEEHARLLHFIS